MYRRDIKLKELISIETYKEFERHASMNKNVSLPSWFIFILSKTTIELELRDLLRCINQNVFIEFATAEIVMRLYNGEHLDDLQIVDAFVKLSTVGGRILESNCGRLTSVIEKITVDNYAVLKPLELLQCEREELEKAIHSIKDQL